MFSPYSHSGFYNSPVSKGIMGTVVIASFGLNVPFHNYRQFFIYRLTDIFDKLQIWRLLTAKIAFLDTKTLLCGALLLYYFRIFERRYGSHKFTSYLLATCTLSTVLELLVTLLARQLGFTISVLPSGPYSLIFPLFIPYYCDIPRVAMTHLLGIPVTGKSFMYILGLQISTSSPESFIVAFCGLISGVLYRINFLRVQEWLRTPQCLSRFGARTVGLLLRSPAPDLSLPMGATIELQRQQQMDRLEQQLAWQQAREHRNRGVQMGRVPLQGQFYDLPPQPHQLAAADVVVNGDATMRLQSPQPSMEGVGASSGTVSGANQTTAVSEQQIEQLVEMGFARDSALAALRTSQNDMNLAMNILLQDAT